MFEKAVQRVPYGILLVDDQRRVWFSNTHAESLIASSSALAVRGGVFGTGSSAHERNRFDSWWKIMTGSASNDGACFSDASLDNI